VKTVKHIRINVSALCAIVIATSLLACSTFEDYEEVAQSAKDKIFRSSSNLAKNVVYTIPAGSHTVSAKETGTEQVDRITFKVLFDSSAIYTTANAANQGDINKLYGLSDCGRPHQESSARFGWRWYKGKLEIWAYTYSDGVRKFTFVDTVQLNKSASFQIAFGENEYIFQLGDKRVTLPRACTGKAAGYRLFPYFGGDETAPHAITIRIENVL
jgi:hypothetical protein